MPLLLPMMLPLLLSVPSEGPAADTAALLPVDIVPLLVTVRSPLVQETGPVVLEEITVWPDAVATAGTAAARTPATARVKVVCLGR